MTQVLFDINDSGVAYLTLNNPDKHNVFDDQLISELIERLEQTKVNPAIRVLVLQANGNSFCAGADLTWMKKMASYSEQKNKQDADQLAKLFQLLNFLPIPTLAVVHGAVYGGGIGLVCCCDIVLASHSAKFAFTEVKLGLIPATISPYVVDVIGSKAARRYFLTAETISAHQAWQLELVNELVEDNSLEQTANSLIQNLLNNSPNAIKEAKQLIVEVANKEINSDLINYTSDTIASIRTSEEAQEGITAFFQRRPARWSRIKSNLK